MLTLELATPDEICRELCLRLRAQRLAQNLQQGELAGRAGVSVGTVRNLEQKGQATFESFIRVAVALGLSSELQDLFVLKALSIKALEAASKSRERASRTRP